MRLHLRFGREPEGWMSHDVFGDPRFAKLEPDRTAAMDLRPQQGSAAIDAGVRLPEEWFDLLRERDAGSPDIGAFPVGYRPDGIGIRGRLDPFNGTAR